MKFSEKIIKLLEEDKPKDNKYEYGCAMLYFDFPDMDKLHTMIDKEDIYQPSGGGYGLETEPHATLLFGLHDQDIEDDDVFKICLNEDYDDLSLEKSSLFENKDFDVLKFDVSSNKMHNVNKELRKLPHTNKFDTYHPHATIAYLKPGCGNKYVKDINKMYKKDYPIEVVPNEVVYSKPNKKVIRKKIK